MTHSFQGASRGKPMDKKLIVVLVTVVIGFHVVLFLSLPSLNIDRIQRRLERDRMTVSRVEAIEQPAHFAAEEWTLEVNGDVVQVFRHEDQAAFEECLALYRDPRRAREALMRHVDRGIQMDITAPTVVAQNGWYILTVTSDNETLRNRIIEIFRGL